MDNLMEKAAHGLASAKPMGKKKKPMMVVTPTDNAGFHVAHKEAAGAPDMESHVFEQIQGLHEHMDKTYGKAGSKWENDRSDKNAMPEGKEKAGDATAKKDE